MNSNQDILIEFFAASPANLRISVVTETFPPEVNGVAMTLGRIVNGLTQRGHVVQVVRPRQAKETGQGHHEAFDQVLSTGVPLPSYGELRFGLPAKSRLLKLWGESRPDVVHVATEGPLGWSAVAAARKLHLPVTSSFHTNFHSYSRHYGMGLLKAPIDGYLRKLHNRTLATMVPTQAMMDELRSRGYHNVTLLSRGVAIEQFTPERRSNTLRQSWGAGPDDLVVLLVGRLAKEKNVNLLLAAYQAIVAKHPGAKLVFVGDGPLRKPLQEACPSAIFAGVQKNLDLATHYASADLFIFPSLTETFGNVVPEALASGLAVLSYANAAAKELIAHGKNGLLVVPGEEIQFVQAAVELAGNATLRNRLRQSAPQSVAHLGWNAIYDSFIQTLNAVLIRHGHSFADAPGQAAASAISLPNA